jgi:ProP effector
MVRGGVDERGFEMVRRLRRSHGEMPLSEFKALVRERGGPQPLKVGIYHNALAALNGAAAPPDLKSALRAYTSNARYLRALSAGACRVGLDGKPAGTVTPEAEAVAKKRLAESVNETAPQVKVAPAGQAAPEVPAVRPAAENEKPAAPKRLSLADLREAGRRRRETAA